MKTLVEKIKEKDKHGFLVELKSLGKNNEIVITLINLYSTLCIQDHLECLQTFYMALAEYQRKKTIEGINSLCKLVFMRCRHVSFGHSTEDIDTSALLYRKQRDIPELNAYRDVVDETVMGLLDVLWDLLIKGGSKSTDTCIAICKHLLEKVCKKSLYKKGVLLSQEKLDSFDLLMNFITHFIECFHFDEPIKKYLKLCKELFYYKCRVKDRRWRVNIIYYSVYVLSRRSLGTSRDHEYDDVDGGGVLQRMKKKNSYEYLKAITRLNTNLINEVRSQKNNVNAPIYYAKSIDVSGFDNVSYLNTLDRKPTVIVSKN